MATGFPASLDSLTNPTSNQTLNSPSHSSQHANINDAMEAVQAKVGVDNSAVTSTLDYKVRVWNPVGEIAMWATTSAPTGWLVCDGSAVSRSTYSGLFAVIGTQYGSGDGSTTFNLPNLKGRVPVGRDSADADWDTMGETRGSKTAALTASNLPAHSHTASGSYTGTSHAHTVNVYNGSDVVRQAGGGQAYLLNGDQGLSVFGPYNTYSITADTVGQTQGGSISVSVSTSGGNGTATGDAFSNIQPSIVLNFIIRH